jgi:hypothetical protein
MATALCLVLCHWHACQYSFCLLLFYKLRCYDSRNVSLLAPARHCGHSKLPCMQPLVAML